VFYCGLPSDILTLIEKRNNLSPTEIYEMVEKMKQKLEMRYESQQAYEQTSSRRFPRQVSCLPNSLSQERMERLANRSKQDSSE